MHNKIVTPSRLKDILRRSSAKKVVFTNGCFDILRYGHVAYLEKAKTIGDILIVALNNDVSVRRLKGKKRPVNNEKDRARVLAALACVDYVVLFHQDTPLELIRALKPDVLVKGGDWNVSRIVGAKEVLADGGKVRVIPYIENKSTTGIIDKIRRLS